MLWYVSSGYNFSYKWPVHQSPPPPRTCAFFAPKTLSASYGRNTFLKIFPTRKSPPYPEVRLGFVKTCAYAAKTSPVLVEKCRHYIKFGIISSICICSLLHAATAAARFRSRTSRYGPHPAPQGHALFFAVWSKKILRPFFFFFFLLFSNLSEKCFEFSRFFRKKVCSISNLERVLRGAQKALSLGVGLWCTLKYSICLNNKNSIIIATKKNTNVQQKKINFQNEKNLFEQTQN